MPAPQELLMFFPARPRSFSIPRSKQRYSKSIYTDRVAIRSVSGGFPKIWLSRWTAWYFGYGWVNSTSVVNPLRNYKW